MQVRNLGRCIIRQIVEEKKWDKAGDMMRYVTWLCCAIQVLLIGFTARSGDELLPISLMASAA